MHFSLIVFGSVRNMANFGLAVRYFTMLPISVPTIIYGLLADEEEAFNNRCRGNHKQCP